LLVFHLHRVQGKRRAGRCYSKTEIFTILLRVTLVERISRSAQPCDDCVGVVNPGDCRTNIVGPINEIGQHIDRACVGFTVNCNAQGGAVGGSRFQSKFESLLCADSVLHGPQGAFDCGATLDVLSVYRDTKLVFPVP